MSDIIDLANERVELDMAITLKAHQAHAPDLPYTGQCYNCGDITGGGRRFCDKDCREDYEKRRAAEARR